MTRTTIDMMQDLLKLLEGRKLSPKAQVVVDEVTAYLAKVPNKERAR